MGAGLLLVSHCGIQTSGNERAIFSLCTAIILIVCDTYILSYLRSKALDSTSETALGERNLIVTLTLTFLRH